MDGSVSIIFRGAFGWEMMACREKHVAAVALLPNPNDVSAQPSAVGDDIDHLVIVSHILDNYL